MTGGRFDSDDGSYRCMYLSGLPATALIERLLPNPKFTASGKRVLTRKQVAGKALAQLRTTQELTLLRLLSEQDLAMAGAPDERLVTCGPEDFARTRQWARQLRDRLPVVQGIVWPSRNIAEHTLVLFGDRVPAGALTALPDGSKRLDDAPGTAWLNGLLETYGIRLRPRLDLPTVFINYRSTDTHAARLLDDQLTARLDESAVFRDNRSIRVGVSFPLELLEKARGAKLLLALIGRQWDENYDSKGRRMLDDAEDWVRREIAEALRHRVLVVPVLVGARKVPPAHSLPGDIRKIAELQFLHLCDGYDEQDVRVLVDKLFTRVPWLVRHAMPGNS